MREAIIQKVLDKKIVAIVRGVYGQDALDLASALYAGGIELLEVTFDQSKPESLNRTSDTVKLLCRELGDKMYFGAGTVTTIEMLNLAKEAGAGFIVALTGNILTMPGLPKKPAAENMDIDVNGKITGLF